MPSETPRLPRETHQRLLCQGANAHLPIVGHEVAEYRKPGPKIAPVVWVLVGLTLFVLLAGR